MTSGDPASLEADHLSVCLSVSLSLSNLSLPAWKPTLALKVTAPLAGPAEARGGAPCRPSQARAAPHRSGPARAPLAVRAPCRAAPHRRASTPSDGASPGTAAELRRGGGRGRRGRDGEWGGEAGEGGTGGRLSV